jgi:hypothetical protein
MPTVPMEIGLHTWATTACHGTSIGLKSTVHAARVLTATGIDILTDAELRQAARADFERRTNGKPYWQNTSEYKWSSITFWPDFKVVLQSLIGFC